MEPAVYDVNKLKLVEELFFEEKIDILDIALLLGESVTTIDLMVCDILAKSTPSGDSL
jgi:hypothetical protein